MSEEEEYSEPQYQDADPKPSKKKQKLTPAQSLQLARQARIEQLKRRKTDVEYEITEEDAPEDDRDDDFDYTLSRSKPLVPRDDARASSSSEVEALRKELEELKTAKKKKPAKKGKGKAKKKVEVTETKEEVKKEEVKEQKKEEPKKEDPKPARADDAKHQPPASQPIPIPVAVAQAPVKTRDQILYELITKR